MSVFSLRSLPPTVHHIFTEARITPALQTLTVLDYHLTDEQLLHLLLSRGLEVLRAGQTPVAPPAPPMQSPLPQPSPLQMPLFPQPQMQLQFPQAPRPSSLLQAPQQTSAPMDTMEQAPPANWVEVPTPPAGDRQLHAWYSDRGWRRYQVTTPSGHAVVYWTPLALYRPLCAEPFDPSLIITDVEPYGVAHQVPFGWAGRSADAAEAREQARGAIPEARVGEHPKATVTVG